MKEGIKSEGNMVGRNGYKGREKELIN